MPKNSRQKGQSVERLAPGIRLDITNPEDTVGIRLRELRKQHGLSMRALSEKCGLSANTLSLIENGKTSPSISTLQQIAIALNRPIHVFFEKFESRKSVIHTVHGQRAIREITNVKIEELGQGMEDEGMWPFLMSFDPHSGSGPEVLAFESGEFIFCLSGQMVYTIHEKEYLLKPGDSLYFPARTPHTFENPADEICQVIIVSHGLAR